MEIVQILSPWVLMHEVQNTIDGTSKAEVVGYIIFSVFLSLFLHY